MTSPFSGNGGVRSLKGGQFQASISTGNQAGIQGALNDVAAASVTGMGGEVRLGPGTYTITSPLIIGLNTILRGSGRYNTVIKADPTFSGAAMITNANQVGGMQWCSLEDLSVEGNSDGGATVPLGVYFKGIGQPSRVRDVSINKCSGVGLKLEGIASNAGNFLVQNTGVSNCPLGGIVLTGQSAGYTFRDIDVEFVNAGVAAVYIDGPTLAFYPAGILIDGLHIEGLLAGSIGILIESARNVHVKDVVYFGSGSVGDLIKITGTTTEVQDIILENLTAAAGSVANAIVDSTNNYTLANGANGVNVTRYDCGPVKHQGSVVFRRASDQAAQTTVTASSGNVIHLTGATTVDSIVTDATETGKILVVWLGGNITVRDNSSSGGNIFLHDSCNMSGVTDGCLTLLSNGVNWLEMARASSTGATAFATMPDNATPSVYGGKFWKCTPAGPTTITNFTGGVKGQELFIIFTNANATITDGANIKLAGAANFVSTADDTMHLVNDGSAWFEVARSVN